MAGPVPEKEGPGQKGKPRMGRGATKGDPGAARPTLPGMVGIVGAETRAAAGSGGGRSGTGAEEC